MDREKSAIGLYIKDRDKLDMVNSMLELGHRLVFMQDGSVYIYNKFVPSDGKANNNTLVEGKDVTFLKAHHSDQNAITSELNSIADRVYWFHKDTLFMNIFSLL